MTRTHRAVIPLKSNRVFHTICREGRWIRGESLSVGYLKNGRQNSRVGLRVGKGFKHAVVRNRLKRQLRAHIYTPESLLRTGIDMVVVAHPKKYQSFNAQEAFSQACLPAGLVRSSKV